MTVLDMNTFNTLKESTGEDFITDLIDTYFEDAITQIDQMRKALASNDAELFRRAAHSFKSNSATFGANDLAALARELEMMGRENNLAVGDRLEVLQDAYEQVKLELSKLR